MKKIILIITLLLLNVKIFAQSRLNSTAAEIRYEFSDPKYYLKTDFDEDGDYYITIYTDLSYVIYYFNDRLTCYLTYILPHNQNALSEYINYYNENYVKISYNQWRVDSYNGSANIELKSLYDGKYCLQWSNYQ